MTKRTDTLDGLLASCKTDCGFGPNTIAIIKDYMQTIVALKIDVEGGKVWNKEAAKLVLQVSRCRDRAA